MLVVRLKVGHVEYMVKYVHNYKQSHLSTSCYIQYGHKTINCSIAIAFEHYYRLDLNSMRIKYNALNVFGANFLTIMRVFLF